MLLLSPLRTVHQSWYSHPVLELPLVVKADEGTAGTAVVGVYPGGNAVSSNLKYPPLHLWGIRFPSDPSPGRLVLRKCVLHIFIRVANPKPYLATRYASPLYCYTLPYSRTFHTSLIQHAAKLNADEQLRMQKAGSRGAVWIRHKLVRAVDTPPSIRMGSGRAWEVMQHSARRAKAGKRIGADEGGRKRLSLGRYVGDQAIRGSRSHETPI